MRGQVLVAVALSSVRALELAVVDIGPFLQPEDFSDDARRASATALFEALRNVGASIL